MNPTTVEDHVRAVLADIAPEADLSAIDRHRSLRDELDIDSMDFLRLMQGLSARTGVDIPEADYARVRSLEGLVAYLAAR